ncbi:MAG: hypothetical protein A3J24_07035 [Deltaproteobacteria bacterium RIFCSPLOWO2_02_FULL_53_8]|nr:MAG: hypothetical protein A3J24_07035 [Deltaproteobacteria bacterium RIFCSPLOWO2_02_FULL_53_8]
MKICKGDIVRSSAQRPTRGCARVFSIKIGLILCAAALFNLCSVAASSAAELRQAAVVKKSTIADAFVGEDLGYQIGFWIFSDLAEGKLSLEKGEGNDYIATLSAWTTGFTGWALKYRKDTFVVHMTLSPDGQRFISKTFEKTVDKSGDVRKGITIFDHKKRLVTWRAWGGGKDERSGSGVIPPDKMIDDPVTAFYNFRYGVYGPVKEGTRYVIYSFPKGNDVTTINLRMASRSELEANKGNNTQAAYLAYAQLDKDLFESKSGNVEILFNKDMLPTEAVAKDILLFGDVRGKLIRMGFGMGLVKRAGLTQGR